jgi:5-formyltetrahydrofolate cyclo-ligase
MKSSYGARGAATHSLIKACPSARQQERATLTDSAANGAGETAEQKAILRGHMKEIRAEAAARDPDAADRLAARFPVKLYERYGPVVAGYVAMRDELDPGPLLARLAGQGARIVLPRVETDGAMTFRDAGGGAQRTVLKKGPFGLVQPSAASEIVRPNLVLAPLLAFDARGRRLGYGKGHYDRAVAALRSSGRVFYLGLAYAQQQVDVIPVDRHDLLLDWVETPLNSVPLFLGRAVAR